MEAAVGQRPGPAASGPSDPGEQRLSGPGRRRDRPGQSLTPLESGTEAQVPRVRAVLRGWRWRANERERQRGRGRGGKLPCLKATRGGSVHRGDSVGRMNFPSVGTCVAHGSLERLFSSYGASIRLPWDWASPRGSRVQRPFALMC